MRIINRVRRKPGKRYLSLGTNITSPVSESISYGSSGEVHDSHLSQAETAHNSHIEKNSFGDKVKAKLHIFWKRLDLFCKTATVSIMIVAILLLVAICIENGLAIFLSVLQLAGLIMAVLMHKGIIKATPHKPLKSSKKNGII